MPRGNPRLRTPDGRQNLVGPRVHAKRKEAKLTQDELCARIARLTGGEWNPSPGDIYRIEAQTRIVSDVELVTLSASLECEAVWLLGISPQAAATSIKSEAR